MPDRRGHGFWPFDDVSEPHVTPEMVHAYFCEHHALSSEQTALPEVLVATFQRTAYDRLCERTSAVDPLPDLLRGGSGTVGDLGVGEWHGQPIAVTRITVGAPAAALRLESVIARGVRVVLVVGSAGSLQPALPLGSLVVVEAAEREDGTSHHYLPAGEVVAADLVLSDLLEREAQALGASPVRGRAWTIDAPYRETVGALERHRSAGVAVVEMEAAAIFAVAQVRGIRAGLIVAVSDELFDRWNPGFGHPTYLSALERATDVVLAAAAAIEPGNE
jgi:uridine phosphorylase